LVLQVGQLMCDLILDLKSEFGDFDCEEQQTPI